jgi:putative membrane protein
MTRPPKPYLQETAEVPDPAAAPPVPDALPDALPEARAMQAMAALSQRRGSGLTRFALWAFGALFGFVLSVAAYDFITGLLARNLILGWMALALLGAALLAGLILALREWAAFLRLARLDGLRSQAVAARAAADLAEARRVVKSLTGLYAARKDTSWGRARLAEREGEVLDADALLDLAEREVMAPLDREARLAIEQAARQVATVTALVPIALADVATALVANLRMVRRIAEIYGGRSGGFGSVKLLRRVIGSLVAAGALALTDDMIGSVAGGGVLSKLSRRFGEGLVNGALTARVGLAAMDLCRPLPFVAEERPAVASLVSRALAGLVSRAER